MRKVMDQPKITQEFIIDMKAFGTMVTKNTIDNTLQLSELKSCSTWEVLLFKEVHVQAHLKIASKDLNDSEKAWEKVLWSDKSKIKLSGISLTHCV